MKTIVTHMAPDVDAITSVWILKRFLPEWNEAEVKFVPAGKTLENQMADTDPNIWHVDTGMGMLDHHQTDENTCAAKRCLEYVISQESRLRPDYAKATTGKQGSGGQAKSKNKELKIEDDIALERMVEVVNDIDHFREVYYPNPTADFYDFGLVAILDGWKLIYYEQNDLITEMGLKILDGIYKNFQNKVWAESELKEKGIEFKNVWGKGIAIETLNDEVVRIAQKSGYTIAVRKDPKKDYVRIKAQPDSKADLTACYNIYRKMDPEATWFLHASRKMLLNGSIKNPESHATKLTLREIVDVLKEVK